MTVLALNHWLSASLLFVKKAKKLILNLTMIRLLHITVLVWFVTKLLVNPIANSATPKFNHHLLQTDTAEQVKYEEDKLGSQNRSLLLTRSNPKRLLLSFWHEVNDTAVLYIDKKKIAKFSLIEENVIFDKITSTDIVFTIKKQAVIRVELVGQKKFAEFLVDNRAPMITIRRYNGIWYIYYRRYSFGYTVG